MLVLVMRKMTRRSRRRSGGEVTEKKYQKRGRNRKNAIKRFLIVWTRDRDDNGMTKNSTSERQQNIPKMKRRINTTGSIKRSLLV